LGVGHVQRAGIIGAAMNTAFCTYGAAELRSLSSLIAFRMSFMSNDEKFMNRAIELALRAEHEGNPPVGAVITLHGKIIAEAGAANFVPKFDGTRHAEMEALRVVPENLWKSSYQMNLYTTLEPCLMCFGSILIHRIGRVVFGSSDDFGGASSILPHLPPYFQKRMTDIKWLGPMMPEACDALFKRLLVYLDKARKDADLM
jgi:tRNA(adenine34) deaminase